MAAILLPARAGCGAPSGQPQAAPAPDPSSRVQYKNLHRDQVTRLVEGRADAVIRFCEDFLAKNPGDLESLYVLAAAYAQKQDLEKAMACVRQAVEAGLPPGRFLAGPRDLLAPLAASAGFREFAREHAVGLLHGPMVGSVTDRSARVWVRTAEEATIEVAVAASPKMDGAVKSAPVRTAKERDYTAVAAVEGLKPDTAYHYNVLVNGAAALASPARLRTFPTAGAKAKFEVAFGGGAGYTPWHERMWTTIAARQPTALLMLGDNVYIDTPKVPQTQRYCYYRRQSRPEWRALAASTAVFAIYDDHDFFDNDCTPGPETDDPPYKRPVWRLFQENWVNPSYGGGEAQPGCWFSFAVGDVDFFMLDCRYYRDRDAKPPTMLGPAGKAWLLAALRASRGTFKVIASSVPWAFGAKPGSNDPWQGYKEEREEIFSFLEANRIEGVVLLAADRHRSDRWRIERPAGYDLHEFMSSRLTNVHTHPVMAGSLFGYNKTCSFGLLTFDTTKADPEVTYRIVTLDDEVVHTFTLTRSQLAMRR